MIVNTIFRYLYGIDRILFHKVLIPSEQLPINDITPTSRSLFDTERNMGLVKAVNNIIIPGRYQHLVEKYSVNSIQITKYGIDNHMFVQS
jgi:hypothetical protein